MTDPRDHQRFQSGNGGVRLAVAPATVPTGITQRMCKRIVGPPASLWKKFTLNAAEAGPRRFTRRYRHTRP